MRLSVMLFPFHRQLMEGTLTPQKLVDELQAVGVRAFEPMMSNIQADPGKWRKLHQTATDAGIVYSCCDIGVNLIGESKADRRAALDQVERDVTFCREELNCPIAMLVGTRPAPGMSNEDGRKFYGEQLAEAVERTKGSGVTLTIENFGALPPFTAGGAPCLEVLEAAHCPDLKFTFDNGNFLFADDRPTEVYGLFKDRIAHVHIKDFARCGPGESPLLTSLAGTGYRSCLIGEGQAEVRETLELLKADGYRGWLSIEVGGDPLREALHGVEWVREVWEKTQLHSATHLYGQEG